MSDFNSRLPVRTESDGDVVVKVADATVPSQQLAVDSAGKVTVKLDDAAGNAITSQTNGSQRAIDVGVNVAGVQVDPRAVRALTSADIVTAAQGAPNTAANGWPVKPTDGTNSQGYTAAGEAKVTVTQPLPAGTNLIGSVDIKDSSGASVTLGQKAMAASLPVVIASDQSDVGVKLHDGADNSITSQANGSQRALDVGVNVAGVQVDPRAIRALTASDIVQANIKDATGTAFSTLNPLPVSISASAPGTEIHHYLTTASASFAAGSSVNHDYSVTSSKTFKGEKFWASASGKIKLEVQTSPDGTTFTTKWVGFNSTSAPNIDIMLGQFTISDTGAGAKIRCILTNLDKSAFDVYSTRSGVEI